MSNFIGKVSSAAATTLLATLGVVGEANAQDIVPVTPIPKPIPICQVFTTVAPDATLFATYQVDPADKTLYMNVAGSTAQTEGAYYSANPVGQFGKIGALLEGSPSISGNVVTRDIYVLDIASGKEGTGVTLNVFQRQDTVSADDDTITIALVQSIALPLTTSANAVAHMAAGDNFIYAGLSSGTNVVRINKVTNSVMDLGTIIDPAQPISSITADSRGYTTITVGTGSYSGFIIYNNNGNPQEDGGGGPFMVDNRNAFVPALVGATPSAVSARPEVKLKETRVSSRQALQPGQ